MRIDTPSWHDTAHHTPRGFRNPWPMPGEHVPALKAARWMAGFAFRPKPTAAPTPFTPLDAEALAGPPTSGVRVTWLGHTTALLQAAGRAVLTDPVFAARVGPLGLAGPKRQVPLPIRLEGLPRIDAVLLSHNHYDHLDPEALARLVRRDAPLVVAPLGVGRYVPGAVTELDWWQGIEALGLRIRAVPARHFSGRTLTDRDRSLWAGFVIEGEGWPRVFWAGDTGLAPHFAQIRERLGAPELVLMPVGAYEPRWFMRRVHVDPFEAVLAYHDLGAAAAGAPFVPLHWGTFSLTEEPLDEPPRLLRQRFAEDGLAAERLRVLPVGGQTTV